MNLCVIPARGGSKRILRKNIREFCGKPMIAWSIEAALGSNCFDRVIVSTEDAEIAELSRHFGAEVPFIRPAALSDDHTGTTEVVAHAIEAMTALGAKPSRVCCLYATAPFVRTEDICRGLDLLENNDVDYAFSVTSYAFPIQRAMRMKLNGCVEMFSPQYFQTRSQDLEEAFHDAGQFYWGTADAWLALKPIFSANSLAVVLPRNRVQDIDTPEDWECAEMMFRLLQSSEEMS